MTGLRASRLFSTLFSLATLVCVAGELPGQARKGRFQEHYENGLELFKRNRLEEAARELIEAVRLDPRRPDIRNLLGSIYDRQGKTDEAIQEYLRAIELDPRAAPLYNNLGIAYLRKGQTERALESFQGALRQDPANVTSHVNLGLVYLDQREYPKAIGHLEQALRMNANDPGILFNLGRAYFLQGEFEASLSVLHKIPAEGPAASSPEIQSLLGMVLARLNRLDEAIAHFRTVLRLRPETSEPYYRLALIFQKKEAWQESRELLERAIQLASAPPAEYYLALGEVYRKLGLKEKAVDAFNKCLAADQNSELARFALGSLLLEARLFRQAAAEFQEIAVKNPLSYESAVHLALALHLGGDNREALDRLKALQDSVSFRESLLYYKVLGSVLAREGDWAGSLNAWLKASELKPEDPESYFKMGLVLLNAGRISDAVKLLSRSLQKFPETASLHVGLAQAYLSGDRHDLAEQYLQKALQLSPDYEEPYFLLGNAYQDRNQYPKAVELYEKAIALDPRRAEFYVSLGLALARSGERPRALQQFEKVLTLDPKSFESHYRIALLHFEIDAYSPAEASLLNAVTLEPNHAPSRYLLFRIYSRLGEKEKAARQLEIFRRLKEQETEALEQRNPELKPVEYYLTNLKK